MEQTAFVVTGITLTTAMLIGGPLLGMVLQCLRRRNGDTEPARIVIGKTPSQLYMFEYSLVLQV